MRRSKVVISALGSSALIVAGATPAIAAGTNAGDSITNNVSVTYNVNSVAQTAVTDSDTFTVDRKVDVVVSEVNGAATSVAPGQNNMAVTYTVTNLTNGTVDFALSADQSSASDDEDITNVRFYVDDGNGVFDAGDTLVTYLDEVAEDAVVTVHIVGDIPNTVVNGETIDVSLVADAHLGGTSSSLGTELTATAGGNTSGVDTVLADGAGTVDASNDGDHSDIDSYVVAAAAISVAKTSTIVSDPVNGTTNPKAIPDAVIEYCITVSNASGSEAATNVAVNDVLPADVTYLTAFGIFIDGDSSCANGSSGGSYNSTDHEIDGTLSDIAAGVTRSLYFRVTIN